METYQQFIKRKKEQFEEERERAIKMKDIGRKGKIVFKKEAWTFLVQHNLPQKVFIIERLRKEKYEGRNAYPKSWKVGDIEYRICYYIVGKNGKAKNKWVWGQFCPLIPHKDFDKLIKKAKKEGTIK